MPGLTRSFQSLIPFGFPLRTTNTIVDANGVLLCGSFFCQSARGAFLGTLNGVPVRMQAALGAIGARAGHAERDEGDDEPERSDEHHDLVALLHLVPAADHRVLVRRQREGGRGQHLAQLSLRLGGSRVKLDFCHWVTVTMWGCPREK